MSTDQATFKTGKLKIGTKIGYGVGQFGDSVGFNVFYFFFLFFLTDFAGVSPAIAGSIGLIAVLWDAISDPIIGYVSDNLNSKYGRRRPIMIAAAIPYALTLWLLFNTVDLSAGMKNAYYIIFAILFWTFYTMYVIPYFALGAEMTQDFNERTSLRTYASLFIFTAVMVSTALPPMILSKTMAAGGTGEQGWNNVGLVLGFIVFLFIVICWRCTKGHELKIEKTSDAKKENIFKVYWQILKLKPCKYLVLSVLFFSGACATCSGAVIYLMTSILSFPESTQSTFYVCLTLIWIAWLPFINIASDKFGKKATYFGSILITGIALSLFYLIGFIGFKSMIIYAIFYGVGNSTFWTLYYSMMYDISELDEFVYGKRREGAITSLTAFAQKLGSALAMWLIGLVLQLSGYIGTATEQSASAVKGILFTNTLLPGILAILSCICIAGYPITAKRFRVLMDALKLKRENKEYSTEGLEKLI